MHQMTEPLNTSTVTCPKCDFQKEEEMPTDSCVFFYECENCKTLLRPLAGIAVSSVPTVRYNVRRKQAAHVAAEAML